MIEGLKYWHAHFKKMGWKLYADVIAISVLSGAHMTYFKEIKTLMNKNKMNGVLLTGGGIIPDQDMETLEKLGVGKLFGPGSDIKESINYIEDWINNRDNEQ